MRCAFRFEGRASPTARHGPGGGTAGGVSRKPRLCSRSGSRAAPSFAFAELFLLLLLLLLFKKALVKSSCSRSTTASFAPSRRNSASTKRWAPRSPHRAAVRIHAHAGLSTGSRFRSSGWSPPPRPPARGRWPRRPGSSAAGGARCSDWTQRPNWTGQTPVAVAAAALGRTRDRGRRAGAGASVG